MQKGKLYLIPTVLSEDALHVIPVYVHEMTRKLKILFVENEKTTRRYLRKTGFTTSFDELTLLPIHEHTKESEFEEYVQYLLDGISCGLMSEAGIPAVADPGSELVKLCHKKSVQVIPLVGPTSIILALMASGLNGQQFVFHGYLPVKQPERNRFIQKMNSEATKGITQIFIETPYRNNAVIKDVLENCNNNIFFCIASDLTGTEESVQTKTISDWKKTELRLGKTPAIFLIG
ncbi:MAG: SAM-dependent methyltransferase [Chitinophagales bacterium]